MPFGLLAPIRAHHRAAWSVRNPAYRCPSIFLLARVPPHQFACAPTMACPSGSAEARLYNVRRLSGQENAQPCVCAVADRTIRLARARLDFHARTGKPRYTSSRRRPVLPSSFKLLETRQLLAVGHRIAVDLAQHRGCIRLRDAPADRIVPRQRLDRRVACLRAVGVQLLQPPAEVIDEPEVRTGYPLAVRSTLSCHCTRRRGIRHGAFLLRRHRRRQEEHLGADVLAGDSSPRCTRPALAARNSPSRSWRSHAPRAIPVRDRPRSIRSEFAPPTTGFWPRTNWPLTTPSAIASVIGSCE